MLTCNAGDPVKVRVAATGCEATSIPDALQQLLHTLCNEDWIINKFEGAHEGHVRELKWIRAGCVNVDLSTR